MAKVLYTSAEVRKAIIRYPSPPFFIDKRFQSAFKKAVHEFGAVRIKETKLLKPSSDLVDLIHRYYIDLR